MLELDIETIEKNWKTYEKLVGRLSDENTNTMISAMGERMCLAPASTHLDRPGCYRGGLVQSALMITAKMRKLNEIYELNIPTESIIKVGLFHDLGKVGDLEDDLFLEQDSSWHREKLGQMFKYNEDVEKMSISHRTLWILQNFGIKLTREEWVAIQLAQGSHFEENRFYVGSEPSLAIIIQQSKSIVSHKST